MEKLLGDERMAELFGFPGFESFIKVTLAHINILRVKAGLAELTFDEFITEISGKSAEITAEHDI